MASVTHQALLMIGGVAAPPAAFASNGSILQSTSPHVPSLPSGLVNGNLLILYTKVRGFDTTGPVISAGWNILDSIGIGGSGNKEVLYWRYYQTGDAAPTITIGSGQVITVMMQYSGMHPSAALVAGSKNSGTGTALTCAAINSTRANSLAISMNVGEQATASSVPPGFSNEGVGFYQNSFSSFRITDAVIAASGASSGAMSATQSTSVAWGAFVFEMKTP